MVCTLLVACGDDTVIVDRHNGRVRSSNGDRHRIPDRRYRFADGSEQSALTTTHSKLDRRPEERRHRQVRHVRPSGRCRQGEDQLAESAHVSGRRGQGQIQAVEDSLKDLETAISNVSSGGEAAVVTAAATVVSSGSALVQSLQDIDCN